MLSAGIRSAADFPGSATRLLIRLLALVALAALPAASAYADPALWVVKGPHARVYLFGTVHVLPPGRAWRTLKIDQAMQASSGLWGEVANPEDHAAMQQLALQYGIDRQHPLSSKLTRSQLSKVDVVARQAGLSGERDVDLMRPWMAALTLSMAPVVQAGYTQQSGVEYVIKPLFVKAGKPVHGFETLSQQIHIFADLPRREELDYLDVTLRDFDRGPQQLNDLIAAWYKGDEDALERTMEGEIHDDYPALYRRVLVDRNLRWMPTLTQLVQGNQTVFVAVGAAHLIGPDGLLALLRKAGYQVDRL